MSTNPIYKDGYILYDTDMEQARSSVLGYGVLKNIGGECSCSANGLNTIISISDGRVIAGEKIYTISSQILTMTDYQDVSYYRKCLIYIDADDGQIKVATGSASVVYPSNKSDRYAQRPSPPDFSGDLTTDDVILSEIWLPPLGRNINSDYVTDRRWFVRNYTEYLNVYSASNLYYSDLETINIPNFTSSEWQGGEVVNTGSGFVTSSYDIYFSRKITSISGSTATVVIESLSLDMTNFWFAFWAYSDGADKNGDYPKTHIEFQVDNDWNKIFSSSAIFTNQGYDDYFWRRYSIAKSRPATERYNVNLEDWKNITGIKIVLVSKPTSSASLYLEGPIFIKAPPKGMITFTSDDWILFEPGFEPMDIRQVACLISHDVLYNTDDMNLINRTIKHGDDVIAHGYYHLYATSSSYDKSIIEDCIKSQMTNIALGCVSSARFYAYPGGSYKYWLVPTIRKYYKMARSTGRGANSFEPGDWHFLNAINADNYGTEMENYLTYVDEAMQMKEWIIFYGHQTSYVYGLVTHSIANNYDIVTFADVWDYYRPLYSRYINKNKIINVNSPKQIGTTETYINMKGTNNSIKTISGYQVPKTCSYLLYDSSSDTFTDYTSQANTDNDNDVVFWKSTSELGDEIYIGGDNKFYEFSLLIKDLDDRFFISKKLNTSSIYTSQGWVSWPTFTSSNIGTYSVTYQLGTISAILYSLSGQDLNNWEKTTINGKNKYWLKYTVKNYWLPRGTVSAFLYYLYESDTYIDYTSISNQSESQIEVFPEGQENDMIYIGYHEKFGGLNFYVYERLNAGKGGGTYVDYWNGNDWVTLLSPTRFEDMIKYGNRNDMFYELYSDWSATTINSVGPYYYVRYRLYNSWGPATISGFKIGYYDTDSVTRSYLMTRVYLENMPYYKTTISVGILPEEIRNIIISVSNNTSSQIGTGSIIGILWDNEIITESIYLTSGQSYQTSYSYYYIENFIKPISITETNSYSLYYGNRIGLLNRVSNILQIKRNNDVVTGASYSVIHNNIYIPTISDGDSINIIYRYYNDIAKN